MVRLDLSDRVAASGKARSPLSILMSEHRWSGWPGAWCLDCVAEDPREVAMADGGITYECEIVALEGATKCQCPTADQWLKCPHFKAFYATPMPSLECQEPGSNRHNPYAQKDH
jgi:hypothetical protein